MKKAIYIGVFFSILFAILFLRDIFLNINKPLGSGDIAFNYFILQNNFEKLSSLNFGQLFDTRMFYPNKDTLALGNSLLPQAVMGLPIYLITKNILISSHSVLIVHACLSFFAMYLLVYKLTKHIGGSLLSGLLYTYNPYVFAHFPHHFELVSLQWMPLIFLFTERTLEKMSWYNVISLSLLLLLQLASSAYYIFFIAVCWPFYLLASMYFKKLSPKIFLNKWTVVGILIVAIGSYLYLSPYIKVRAKHEASVSLEYVRLLSLKLSDFLFTTPTNMIYGGLTQSQLAQKIRDPYTFIHYTEHSYFIGITTLVLLLISFWLLLKNKFTAEDKKIILSFLFIALIALIFSFGPSFFPYLLLYKFIPLANGLSAPSRFMVIGFIALFIVCAFTLKYLKLNIIVITIIIFIITLEYWQKPLIPITLNPQIKEFYSWLESKSQIRVVIEIPMANGFPEQVNNGRDFMADSQYLLYGVYHHKKMLNGYNSFIPQDSIGLGVALMNFPSKNNLKLLKRNGVDTVIVHTDEYLGSSTGEEVLNTLKKLEVKHLYSEGSIHAFSID